MKDKLLNEIGQIKKMMGINERRSDKFDIYFDTFSEAVQSARKKAEDDGYTIDEDDWFHEVTTGYGKPEEGHYTRMSIGLFKNNKLQRKALQIIVYNRGNDVKKNYELTTYVN